MDLKPIEAPQAWLASDMRANRRWVHELSSTELEAIDTAYRHVRDRNLKIPFTAADFPLGAFAPRMRELQKEIEYGTGVMLIRGLDVDRYGLEGTRLVYWGLGAHLGNALAQNPWADLLVDVRDEGGDPYKDPTARGYHTAQYLPFHNDQGDVVGLLCYRRSKSGGLSCISSSAAIHNEILRTRPDLARVLYGDFHADVRGEEPAGRKPWYAEPRYAMYGDKFYAQHGPTYVKSAQRFPEVPRLTDAQLEAMALIDTLVATEPFRLDMDFLPGDIQFLNNHLVLHSRTGFEDFDAPENKRRLLRLWLVTPRYADIVPFFRPRFEDMGYWMKHPTARPAQREHAG